MALVAAVAEDESRVARHPDAAGPLDGAPLRIAGEARVIHLQELGERTLPARVCAKGRGLLFGRQLRAVERADVLTRVAAEQPAPERRAQRLWHRPALLDGEVGDAAPGIELTRGDERLR